MSGQLTFIITVGSAGLLWSRLRQQWRLGNWGSVGDILSHGGGRYWDCGIGGAGLADSR